MCDIEQFVHLAKSNTGLACNALIQQILSNKKLFVFGELLDVPSIMNLRGTQYEKALNTLELFAFGVYTDYIGQRDNYLNLTEYHERKLKLLTIVTLASNHPVIEYSLLQRELNVQSTRELEDLMIEAMNLKLVSGKLDQREKVLKVKDFASRDVPPQAIDSILDRFNEMKSNCMASRQEIESNIQRLKNAKQLNADDEMVLDQVVEEVKNSIKEGMRGGNLDKVVGLGPDLSGGSNSYSSNRNRGGLHRNNSGNMRRLDRASNYLTR